ncbi:hypothetical protein [Hymenobacter guriensis]|uniref:Uncharacterized protein n=1 Tax=Hymenobacter guriensis TaxID=2793065 RepID=A0ABS0L016_9BACT|nr:hypothetical protein [Hymenobacter guriensis]MBG8553463.1 hypothetical protein [Hymenobacter guriensis]
MRPEPKVNEVPLVYPTDSSVPTVKQLRALKEQLSVEVWLYLLCAEEVALPVNESLVQHELRSHQYRVLILIGQDLGDDLLASPKLPLRFQWVQYQLLHASEEQIPSVYYEQSARALVAEAKRLQTDNQIWLELSPELQADYLYIKRPPIAAIPLAPRIIFSGGLKHPGLGKWLVQELIQRPLPEIEPYLTLTWVFVAPDLRRSLWDHRRTFTRQDITYLLDLLDGDWSYLTTGGRPQLARAHTWFARHQYTLLEAPAVASQGLTAQQVALISIYRGEKITSRKAEQLAQQTPGTSGKKIYNKYRQLELDIDRLNTEGKKRSFLIKDIEAVLLHLTGPAKKHAEDELFKLK